MSKQAVLPDALESRSLSSMSIGETGWTVPWAMWVDRQRRCWLNPGFLAESDPGGTVEMKVELRDDGYHVWPPRGTRYSISAELGSDAAQPHPRLPVVELHSPR